MTTTQEHPAPICDLSGSEMFDSFTKFDEIAVAKAFGEDIYVLREKPFDFLRCLAFTHQRRLGLSHEDAKEYAYRLTIKDLDSYFQPEAEELDPEDPETDQGKDSTLNG